MKKIGAIFCRMVLLGFVAMSVAGAAHAPTSSSSSSSSSDRERPTRESVPDDVAEVRSGQIEYVVAGPISSAQAAINALEGAGATLVLSRDLTSLNRRIMTFSLGTRLDLAGARNVLAQAAPDHRADFNHLYAFAQGNPRLYAANLIGDPVSGGCRLGTSKRIGMIDGPMDRTHPALTNASIFEASALSGNQRAPDTRHGTAVAALIVGEDSSGVFAGFAAGARLYAVNAFAREHSGVAADVERIGAALDWLLANNVRFINLSFVGPDNVVFADLLSQATRQGAILIAAAGNQSRKGEALPATSPNVIAVTAVDAALRRYRSANRGTHIEFAAPGVDIYVAKDSGGGYATGTSYAAPILSGLALRSGASTLSEVRRRLQQQSRDLGTPGRDTDYGWGLVQGIGC